jgi:hypothetical protein
MPFPVLCNSEVNGRARPTMKHLLLLLLLAPLLMVSRASVPRATMTKLSQMHEYHFPSLETVNLRPD